MENYKLNIEAAICDAVTFACQQNDVPLIRDLAVVNGSEHTFENLILDFRTSPSFVGAKIWKIDRIGAGSTLHINKIDVQLDGEFLHKLSEAITGQAIFTLLQGETVLAERQFPIRVLAYDEWGGLTQMADLLAAFSLPNDPAVEKILKGAATILGHAGKSTALDGYKTGSRTRVWEVVSAIWSSVAALKLDYALPPASFESTGQKIRTPTRILEGGLATCLDLVVLFTAAAEQAGLNPFIVMTEGHAFPGVWLQPEQFASLTVDDASSIRKRLVLNELLVFEATYVTQHPSPSFSKAVEQGAKQLSEDEDSKFQVAIDIRRARMQRVRPLPQSFRSSDQGNTEDDVAMLGLEEAPQLPNFDGEIPKDVGIETPQTRLLQWQRHLLDLSLRNPLIHFRATSGSVKFVAPDPGKLEDRLAQGAKLKIAPAPSIAEGTSGRSNAIHLARHGEDLDLSYAIDALDRNEVLVKSDEKDLNNRLTNLYRTAKKDLEEGGANTLFIAIGFLSWQREEDERKFKAPLIMIPVELERKSIRGGVKMSLGEDEPRFNTTLLQMLRDDFDLDIKGFDGSLPQDEYGVDIPGVLRSVREAVKEEAGFEVFDEVVLGIFSFAKYLMWKDLVDRTDQLKQNPVVQHLIETPREKYARVQKFPSPGELDRHYTPEVVYTSLPADSSQLAAVLACAQGKDFVLIGPPGTGKSQTIANMISQCLAEGKRVLFVAEKITALNVVYRRLNKLGIGDFCLELHSNKAKKIEVLEQLRKAWRSKGALSETEWKDEAARLKTVRDQLNQYVAKIHQKFPNGLSLYMAMGNVISNQDLPIASLYWPSAESHSSKDLERIRDIVGRIEQNYSAVADLHDTGISVLENTNWSPGWAREITGAIHSLCVSVTALDQSANDLETASGIAHSEKNSKALKALGGLARNLARAFGHDFSFAFASDAQAKIAKTEAAVRLMSDYRTEESQLSCRYADLPWKNLATDVIGQELDALKKMPWYQAVFARRRLNTQLCKHAGAEKTPDIFSDVPRLAEMARLGNEIVDLGSFANSVPGWNGFKSDITALQEAIEVAKDLRRSIGDLSASPNSFIEISKSVSSLVVEANDLLEPTNTVGLACAGYLDVFSKYLTDLSTFLKLANLQELPSGTGQNYFEWIQKINGDIRDHSSRLNSWCAWQRAKAEAIGEGLSALVTLLEAGAVPVGRVAQAFEYSYANWWVNAVVDNDPVLQAFVPAEHERRIKLFSEIDERFLNLTAKYVRARLCSGLPPEDDVKKGSELGVLRRELEKKRAHKALRQLVSEMPEALTQIAPCLLMSPLSIAQYLSPDHAQFDVVIFDEASQITVWDAIGAISRGKSVVIVGDPQQLPPTNFFARQDDGPDDEEQVEQDLASILDECLGAGLPEVELTWHYRSKYESLVAFSNKRFYGGNLVTFPSPVTNDRAVKFIHVEKGVYDRGGSRTNKGEAEAIVAEILRRLNDAAFVATGQSIGVVTFNGEQQKLIEDLLDAARSKNPALDRHFDETFTDEPVFVKNLERVQGDERDVMLFSITYGPDAAGVVRMNFGPLNQAGGPRRLNVAITRARAEMLVFSSMQPDQIDLTRTAALGVKDLKHFLEFAQRGPSAIAAQDHGSVGEYESPFERAVALKLAEKGWRVIPQIGVSTFRIDLGIVHPSAPGRFLAGIECDGATYHRSATARDRDKLREQVLRGLGWEICRVWSTDWWIDAASASDKLHVKLQNILANEQATSEVKEKERKNA